MEYYVLSILFQQRGHFFYSSRAVTLCTKQCSTVSGVEECEWHSHIHYSYLVPLGWIGKAECFAWCYYCLTFLILLCLLWSKSLQQCSTQEEWSLAIAAKGVINVILLKMNCCRASDNHLPQRHLGLHANQDCPFGKEMGPPHIVATKLEAPNTQVNYWIVWC